MDGRIGIIAGWGELPVAVTKALMNQGHQIYCVGLTGHADPQLQSMCHGFHWGAVSRAASHLRFFRRHNVKRATMVGKVFKSILFKKALVLRHIPDFMFLRFFAAPLFSKRNNRKDDTLLMSAVNMYQHYGIHIESATELAPEILVPPGPLSTRSPNSSEQADIEFGWQLAKEMGRLDVGQSVVIKDRAAIAVEALEGTDACIRRAGELCGKGGLTVVKVAKPQQDMRFDVPTVGIETLRSMLAANARTLAIEAQRTILLNREEVIRFANEHRIAIVAIDSAEVASWAA